MPQATALTPLLGRLERRQRRMRHWLGRDPHPLLREQLRSAWASLQAVSTLLQAVTPLWVAQQQRADTQAEQAANEAQWQRRVDAVEAERLNRAADHESDDALAEAWRGLAAARQQSSAQPARTDGAALRLMLLRAGHVATLAKLMQAADLLSRRRDREAWRTLALDAAALGWKVVPFAEPAQGLMAIVRMWLERGQDLWGALAAMSLRRRQSQACSSLLRELDAVRELGHAWGRQTLAMPFVAAALGLPEDDPPAQAREWATRLQRAEDAWRDPTP